MTSPGPLQAWGALRTPVSYTHLDVYKRQLAAISKIIAHHHVARTQLTHDPVSYTHLVFTVLFSA